MEKDLVTIIVPVYKVEKFLNKCITSLVEQTYKNLEIILVDDGSPDNCPTMCDEWANKDKRIKVIHKVNGGVSSARNIGIENSQGTYLCFCDSDDYLEPTYVEELHKAITTNEVQLSVCGKANVYRNEKKVISSTIKDGVVNIDDTESFYKCFTGVDLISPCNKLYIKSLLSNLKFNEKLIWGEDLAFNFEYISQIKSIACVENALYNCVANGESVTRSNFNQITVYDEILIPYERKFATDINNPKVLEYFATLNCINFLFSLTLIKKQKSKKEAKLYFEECLNGCKFKNFQDTINLMSEQNFLYRLIKRFIIKKNFKVCLFLSGLLYIKRKLEGELAYIK